MLRLTRLTLWNNKDIFAIYTLSLQFIYIYIPRPIHTGCNAFSGGMEEGNVYAFVWSCLIPLNTQDRKKKVIIIS